MHKKNLDAQITDHEKHSNKIAQHNETDHIDMMTSIQNWDNRVKEKDKKHKTEVKEYQVYNRYKNNQT